MSTLKRREFLTAGALAMGGALLTSRVAFAGLNDQRNQGRLVFVIMRGALDGIAVVPPYGDRDYASQRRELALSAPGTAGGALPLDSLFGLHPSLGFLHECYAARELLVFHAIASPYRERSHFDGQDVLESGGLRPHALQTGWLNRALANLPAAMVAGSRERGVAVGQNVPLVLRGQSAVTSWSPSRLASLDEDTLGRLADLYSSDPVLSKRLADALTAEDIASGAQADSPMAGATPMTGATPMAGATPMTGATPMALRAKPTQYTEVVRAAAGFLRRDEGPRVAVFDTTGWDTHANEGSAEGQLANRLAALDAGLRTLRDELGGVWRNTAVLLATEFGRTVATNGTRGTDHGTATALFLVGGAVQGGRVVADWPGLSPRSLQDGRDLKPTRDFRAVFKGLLSEHLRVASVALEDSVFPGSASVKPYTGMMRS